MILRIVVRGPDETPVRAPKALVLILDFCCKVMLSNSHTINDTFHFTTSSIRRNFTSAKLSGTELKKRKKPTWFVQEKNAIRPSESKLILSLSKTTLGSIYL